MMLQMASASIFAQEATEFALNSMFKKTYTRQYIQYTRVVKQQDTLFQYNDYTKSGKLVQTGFYTDTNFTKPVGHTVFYQHGKKLYEGNYLNGKPAGYWYFFDRDGMLADSLFYAFRDTIKRTGLYKEGIATEKALALKNEHLKNDTTAPAAKVEEFPAFPGGLKAWKTHLQRNLYVPELVMETCPYSSGTVQVQFVVCNDGELCSVQALNSVHPLADLIAVKAVRNGPRWIPGVQNGRKVKTYQRQPITFLIQD